eukprot:365401-Chlamydomonas_euryale.AAC.5
MLLVCKASLVHRLLCDRRGRFRSRPSTRSSEHQHQEPDRFQALNEHCGRAIRTQGYNASLRDRGIHSCPEQSSVGASGGTAVSANACAACTTYHPARAGHAGSHHAATTSCRVDSAHEQMACCLRAAERRHRRQRLHTGQQ